MTHNTTEYLQHWRITILEEYLTRQKYMVHTALTGTGNSVDLLSIMSMAGIRGIGEIKHFALTYQHQTRH